jgi:hypothetical protein
MNSRANGSSRIGDSDRFPCYPASPRTPVPVCHHNTESKDSMINASINASNTFQLTRVAYANPIRTQQYWRCSKHVRRLMRHRLSKRLHGPSAVSQASDLHRYLSHNPRELFFKDHPAATRQSCHLSPASSATFFRLTRHF